MKRLRIPPRARLPLAVLGLFLVALAGIGLGLRVAGPETYSTPLGTVRLEVDANIRGEIDAYVPLADWGVRAHAFTAPVRLRAEIRSLRREGVLSAASGDERILKEARASADEAAAKVLRRALLFGLLGAVVAAAILALALVAARRPRRTVVKAVLGTLGLAVLVLVGSAWAARATFDPEALERPRFYARGAELMQLLDAASKTQERAERYKATAETGVRSFSELLAANDIGPGGFDGRPTGTTRDAVLVSDLHNNTLVMRSLEALARGGRPIFLAGDFGHQGSEAEARIVAPRLARLGQRAVAVSGNHDSAVLMRTLVRSGITVLTGRGRLRADGTTDGDPVIDVMGLEVAGVADPLEWRGDNPSTPERIFGFSELEDGDEERAAAERRLIRWFDALPERPDVVLIHQNGLAQYLARELTTRGQQQPLTILTGHDHKQHITRHGQIVVVDAGTVGAGGILGAGREEVGLGELHFLPDRPLLRAVDLILAEPFTGDAKAERVIVEGRECDDDEPECRLAG